MPFVPFKKKSIGGEPDADDAPGARTPPAFSKKSFGRKRKTGRVAPAQKALMNPGGRAMGGGGR